MVQPITVTPEALKGRVIFKIKYTPFIYFSSYLLDVVSLKNLCLTLL